MRSERKESGSGKECEKKKSRTRSWETRMKERIDVSGHKEKENTHSDDVKRRKGRNTFCNCRRILKRQLKTQRDKDVFNTLRVPPPRN